MIEVELLVKLKIPDVTALTAANSLRRRMGYEDALTELRRADYYRIGLNVGSADDAVALATELAEETNQFVNPNKHVYEIRLADRDAGAASEAGSQTVEALVIDPDDGSAQGSLGALRGRLGYGDKVASLSKGVLWLMTLKSDSPEEARKLAEELTVTTRIDQGLLMNPHFQECTIR